MFKSRRSIRDEEEESDETSRARRLKAAGGRPGQVSEEKNKFALSVLRRVRVKLEGREPDSLRKVSGDSLSFFLLYKNLMFNLFQSSVGEQVDFLIREAMNTENLALMYEGWTAWI